MIKTYNGEQLVSIGIPTYNRPVLLRRALKKLTTQTYKNLEIIVSDNASPGNETANVVAEFMAHDPRISYFRQLKNLGVHNNYFFVFEKAKGEFYMWAADDDQWEPWFVERCVEALVQTPKRVAAITEVQYVGNNSPYPFFSEGYAFYRCSSPRNEMLYVLDNNYGNLIYSIFRRDALMTKGNLFWEVAQLTTYNEITPLLHAAQCGVFIVLPEIGMYKQVPENVYLQARWEYIGGRLPRPRVNSFASIYQTVKYHVAVYHDIKKGATLLSLDADTRKTILKRAKTNLFKHVMFMIVGYKPVNRKRKGGKA
jgi:glycosyltransferase involved in cell wall biosynthesis